MWSGKFMARYGIKGYHVLLICAKNISADDVGKTQEKEISTLKLLNFTAYNEITLTQKDTV